MPVLKIVTIVLLFVSAGLSIKHGIDTFRPMSPEQWQMMERLGVTKAALPYLGVLSILIGVMLFFPRTFFFGNLLNAIIILLIMALSLKAGDTRTALIEIPFLALPLVLIWLKYPFKS